MHPRRNILRFVKKLVTLSFESDFVSEERVSAIIATLREHPPRNPKRTLKAYLLRLRDAMRQCEARIEYAGEIRPDIIKALQSDLETHYKRKLKMTTLENTDLLAGFRIFIGDDVWDTSVAGQIEKLSQSF